MNRTLNLLGLALHFLELLFSFITPRNKNIWCFGSSFTGNAKYMFLYMCNYENYRCVWVGGDQDVNRIKNLGFEAYKSSSLNGLFFQLISGIYVYNSYVGNVGLYTWGRTKKINLWHGVGLKNIENKITIGPIAERYHSTGLLNKLRYMNFRIKPDIFLSTSAMMNKHFAECFQINENCIVEGIYPRCELLLKGTDYSYEFIKKYEGREYILLVDRIKKYAYTYIYMPTFRDNNKDFLKEQGVDFKEINEILKKNNRLLILKFHPDTNICLTGDFSNIILIENKFDLYPVMPFTNCLITDYSSIYYDYILMEGKDVFLFIPDYEDYIRNCRDLAYPYLEFTKGIIINNYEELLNRFRQDTKEYVLPDIGKIRNTFWSPKQKDMKQLIKAIENKLK